MCELCSRREFLAATAAVPLWALLPPLGPATRPALESPAGKPPALPVHPFELKQVRLLEGPWLTGLETNRRYMMGLDPDLLLHMFRITAGLPSTAEPYGGWEAPNNELRGHFVGHYLSACALMAAQSGDAEIGRRGAGMVSALAECQKAHGDGYLSAFPREFFDRLKSRQRVWAPFYTYHKILAGMLDTWLLSGDREALAVAEGMAAWTARWAEPLSDQELQQILNVEHGGMNEVLYNLSAATGKASYRALADRFAHEKILAPLAEGRDELTGVHGNTNIPKIVGEARRYELEGAARSRAIAEYFWCEVALHRSYATGGSTSGEAWRGEPDHLAATLSGGTQETCTTYNILKLTRHLFTWRPDPLYADFYERAFWNGILGTQHPADGEKLYYTPLEPGFWKLFGTPGQAFWCCHGSGVENFSKPGDSIYFRDARGLYVNQFVASLLDWPERGLVLRQETRFPESDTVTLGVKARKPVRLSLRVRVPYWTAAGGSLALNGAPLDRPLVPGSWLTVERAWKDGDRLELRFPMRLHAAPMPDDPAIQAIMYGPLVLAGRMGTAGITDENRRAEPTAPRTVPDFKHPDPPPMPVLTAKSDDPADWITPVEGRPLEFRTAGQSADYTLAPLNRIFDERYAVYWKVVRG